MKKMMKIIKVEVWWLLYFCHVCFGENVNAVWVMFIGKTIRISNISVQSSGLQQNVELHQQMLLDYILYELGSATQKGKRILTT